MNDVTWYLKVNLNSLWFLYTGKIIVYDEGLLESEEWVYLRSNFISSSKFSTYVHWVFTIKSWRISIHEMYIRLLYTIYDLVLKQYASIFILLKVGLKKYEMRKAGLSIYQGGPQEAYFIKVSFTHLYYRIQYLRFQLHQTYQK